MADWLLLVSPRATRPIRAFHSGRSRSCWTWFGTSATLAGYSRGGGDCVPTGGPDRGLVWRGGGVARAGAAAPAGEMWGAMGSDRSRRSLEHVASGAGPGAWRTRQHDVVRRRPHIRAPAREAYFVRMDLQQDPRRPPD